MLEKIGSKFTYRTFVGSSTNKNDVCELCNQTFDWKHKQHQCKRCLRYVCYNCGPDKAIIPSHDLKIPHRICKNCKDDSKHQTQQMEVEKCKFGQLSGVGKRWAHLAQGDDFVIDKAQEEYSKSLSKILKNASNETKNQIQTNLQRYFKENKKTLNYSLFDWNYKMCLGEQEISLVTKISNVLHCFFQSNPVRLTRNLVFITTYILYFCDEAICLTLLLFLHQKVLPSRFQYHKLDAEENKPIDQEVKFLMDCIIEQSNSTIDSLSKSKIKVFLDTFSSDILTTLMFNHIEFYVGYFLFNQLLINREFSIYEKFLANICLELSKIIAEVQIDDIPLQIMKNIQLEQLTTFLQMEDQQKRKYRTSLTGKDQLSQQSQIIITQQQQQQQQQAKQEEQQQQSQSINNSSLDYLLDSFIGLLKDNQHSKIEYMISNEKYNVNKNQIKELYQAIKRQNEELSGLRNSIGYSKQDQDQESDANNSRTSRSSLKLEDTERTYFQRELSEKNNLIRELEDKVQQSNYLIQRYIEQQQQSELDNFNIVNNLKAQLSNNNQSSENNKEVYKKTFEQKEENYRNQISKLHSEISSLKFEINNLQIQLQQSQKNKTEFENQLKEKINSEYEQEALRLTEEKVSLLKKTLLLQQQNSSLTQKFDQKELESLELKKQLEEQKKNTEEMSLLYGRQNEQSEKLNKHIDDLNIQILGLKRKDFDQNFNQTHVQTNIIKEIQENNIQIRNNLLQKEKELYNLKQKFVEVNQLKIEYFDQMQNQERINKEINQTLKQYEGKEIHQLKSFYEEKISLLQQTQEEQMNRLLSQYQHNQPYQQEQKTTIQQQSFKESQSQQEKQMIDEQSQDQSVLQTDDCTIF